MIHIIKNMKWVITTSVVCILLGVLTFFTFINKSFIDLNERNLQILLIFDFILLTALPDNAPISLLELKAIINQPLSIDGDS